LLQTFLLIKYSSKIISDYVLVVFIAVTQSCHLKKCISRKNGKKKQGYCHVDQREKQRSASAFAT